MAKRSKRIVLVEQNYQSQLGMLIRMECGLDISDKILKYDGRPFFYDELLPSLLEKFADKTKDRRGFVSTAPKENNPRGLEPACSSS
jgi:2-oxoglutarate/2-oxoacid ferredoxin oxidoreductase subunit alpha